MLELAFTSDPARFFTTQLGESKHTLEARYNERSESWTFDVVRDVDQVRLVAGVPLLLGQEMLAPYALQIGGLVATDLGAGDDDAGPDDLGERVIVTYLTTEELIQLGLSGAPGLSDAGGSGIGGGGDTPTPGGGSGGTFVPLVATDQHADDSGNEVIDRQFTVDLSPNAAGTIILNVSFLAASASGTATWRAYVGGGFGVIDGVPAGSATRTGAALAPIVINAAIANPGGVVPVKITMQSSGLGSDATSDDLTGTIG